MPYQQHEAWDHFPTRLTMKMIANPFSVINEFFDQEIDIVNAREELKNWWRSAFSEKCLLTKSEMVSLIGFRDQLLTLIEASSLLPVAVEEFIEMEGNELLNTSNFCGSLHEGYTPWDYFPRYLNKKEYVNPQLMLSKFFAYKTLPEWRDVLEELFSAAISDCSIHTCTNDEDIMKSCEYIMKLFEALYLLKIRSK